MIRWEAWCYLDWWLWNWSVWCVPWGWKCFLSCGCPIVWWWCRSCRWRGWWALLGIFRSSWLRWCVPWGGWWLNGRKYTFSSFHIPYINNTSISSRDQFFLCGAEGDCCDFSLYGVVVMVGIDLSLGLQITSTYYSFSKVYKRILF